MKKVWNSILKFRLYIIIAVFVIVMVFAALAVKAYVSPEDKNTFYGDRLEGIDKVPLTDEIKNNIMDFIKKSKDCESSIRVQGKIIKIYITLNSKDDTIDKMKEFVPLIIEKFDKEYVDFYDFEVYINNENANYNMIASKHYKNTEVSYSSDSIVKEEVTEDEKEK